MANERYTPIGCGLWSWQPWIERSSDARLLWLALYTSSTAKRSVPGLWPGTLHLMADDCRLSLNTTYNALEELIVAKMVVYDASNRLARLTALPDSHDRAHNAQALSGWWTRFLSLPKTSLRDAHVPLVWWLVEQGRPSLEGKNEDQQARAQKGWNTMIDTWRRTFGTIVVPSGGPTFQPLSSSDTGTMVQPSLFAPPPNEIKNSDPRPVHGPTTPRGPDQDPDLDLDLQEGERRGVLLQLVPAEPHPTPQDIAADARNERARELRQAMSDAAESAGISWIVNPAPKPA